MAFQSPTCVLKSQALEPLPDASQDQLSWSFMTCRDAGIETHCLI